MNTDLVIVIVAAFAASHLPELARILAANAKDKRASEIRLARERKAGQ